MRIIIDLGAFFELEVTFDPQKTPLKATFSFLTIVHLGIHTQFD